MEVVATFVFWLVPATIYLGPSIVAVSRNHYRAPHIVVLNVLLGWTIVGLFVAFAWALSSTRDPRKELLNARPTDFGERLFQNRNIIRQRDGGAIVYPALMSDTPYRLTQDEFPRFLQLRKKEARRNLPRGMLILMSCIGFFLGFRHWLGPEQATAPTLLTSTALVTLLALWDLVLRPKRDFLTAFPEAPRAKDPDRRLRRILASLISFDPVVCTGATLLCCGLMASMALQAAYNPEPITLRAQDASILVTGLAILGTGCAVYGHLTWHHMLFFLKYGRQPMQRDIDLLAAGVKPGAPVHDSPSNPAARPMPNGTGTQKSSAKRRGRLAAALRLGLR